MEKKAPKGPDRGQDRGRGRDRKRDHGGKADAGGAPVKGLGDHMPAFLMTKPPKGGAK